MLSNRPMSLSNSCLSALACTPTIGSLELGAIFKPGGTIRSIGSSAVATGLGAWGDSCEGGFEEMVC